MFQDVQKPTRDEWGKPLESLQTALELERNVNQSLLDLHGVASQHNDDHFCDFIEGLSLYDTGNCIVEWKCVIL
jgi:ferritin heavy chain